MNRRTWFVAAAAAGAAGIGTALWHNRLSEPSPESQEIWGLKFEKPSGGELVLANFLGNPLLLNFWATWCPPCVTEMPLLDQFQKQEQARGWQVVGLAIDNAGAVQEFLLKHPVGFAIGLAGTEGVALSRALGNVGGALPFSVVFDRRGKTVRTKLGRVHEKELADWAAAMG